MANLIPRERLLVQLSGYNPWWRGQKWIVPAFQRTVFSRAVKLLGETDLRRAIMLSGPRRVGKSVVLQQVAQHLLAQGIPAQAIVYASLDDPILKLSTISELLAIYREEVRPASSERCYLLLDELHYSRGWEQEVKTLVDHHPEYRVLATGSASFDAGEEELHAGVGRWITIPVPTLSFYEFAHIRNEGVPADSLPQVLSLPGSTPHELISLRTKLSSLSSLFRRYLVVGGFPETAKLSDVALCQKLLREDVVDRVLKRDIVSLFKVRNVDDVERLFLFLCLHSGGQLNVEDCGRQLGVPRPTVQSYLSVLERSHLLFRLSQDAVGGRKLLKQRHKYYLIDAALRNAVLLMGEEALQDPAQTGLIVETAVIRHMMAAFYQKSPRFSFWRDPSSDKEVDIVYRDGGITVPIEVKFRDRASASDAPGLRLFCEREPDAQPLLVTRNEDDFSIDPIGEGLKPLLRMPAHFFCYLIGHSERMNAAR